MQLSSLSKRCGSMTLANHPQNTGNPLGGAPEYPQTHLVSQSPSNDTRTTRSGGSGSDCPLRLWPCSSKMRWIYKLIGYSFFFWNTIVLTIWSKKITVFWINHVVPQWTDVGCPQTVPWRRCTSRLCQPREGSALMAFWTQMSSHFHHQETLLSIW